MSQDMHRKSTLQACCIIVCVSLMGVLITVWVTWAQTVSSSAGSPSPDVKTIVAQLEEHNRQREARLENYSVERSYKVENKRINKSAEVAATMIFVAPGEKLFEIRSASGTGFMRKGVINRIIETEQKNALPDQKPKSAITTANYSFEWVGTGILKGRPQFVLHAKPLRKDQLLFDAKIWIDTEDFAVSRIEGRPAKNPSFWTRKVDFTHEYEKIGPFWLPVRNHSVTQVFIFGKTTTELEYTNYQINQPGLAERAEEIRKRGDKLEIQMDPKDKKQ